MFTMLIVKRLNLFEIVRRQREILHKTAIKRRQYLRPTECVTINASMNY